MFRKLESVFAPAIALASVCLLMGVGCSRQEQIEIYEETVADESLRYVVPEGWSPKQVSGLQRAAFVIGEGDITAEVTAICLPGTVSQLLANVNRWRRQIGLENTTQDDLDAALQAIDVDGRRGRYIMLTGPADAEESKSMLVVLIDEQSPTWFFRMLGDSELVHREQDRFESFLKSVTFAAASGAAEEVLED